MNNRKLIEICKDKLLHTKAELLNRLQTYLRDFRDREPLVGDEADQSLSLIAENQLFADQRRLREQLFEIESALARIEKGTFGICEETEDQIEEQRLLAIPWTRVSIEGAELRESNVQSNRA
jgi:DnaK suppressor protein